MMTQTANRLLIGACLLLTGCKNTHLVERTTVATKAVEYERALDKCVDQAIQLLESESSNLTKVAAAYEQCATGVDAKFGRKP